MMTSTFTPNPAGIAHLFSPTGDVGIWMQTVVERVEAFAKSGCPKDTGALADSIEGRVIAGPGVNRGGVTGIAIGQVQAGGDQAPYAVAVHEGTKPHEIKPKNSPVLVFPSRSSGMTVFTTLVNHPGTKAQPFLMDALRAVITA